MEIAPTAGHNNPPDAVQILRQQLEETHRPLIDRQEQLIGMEARLPATCEDEDTAAKLADAIKSCTTFTKTSEATRLAANEPYRASIRTVDGFFKSQSDPIDKLKTKMGAILTDYQRRVADAERRRLEAIAAEERRVAQEAERKAREEARLAREAREAEERRAEEARKAAAELAGKAKREAEEAERKRAAAAAAELKQQEDLAAAARDKAREAKQVQNVAKEDASAKAADLSRSRSNSGSVASLRSTWDFSVEDPALVPREYLSVSEGAIRTAIKANTSKDGRKCLLKIPGVKIFEKQESIVR
jgi:flagellar biosynthesis GTPase FlhF